MEWQPLFDIALQLGTSEEELRIMAYRVAEDLLGKKRTAESARVLLDYAQDTREAVVSLVQGNHIYEARRVVGAFF
jgi:elongator complex protein 1